MTNHCFRFFRFTGSSAVLWFTAGLSYRRSRHFFVIAGKNRATIDYKSNKDSLPTVRKIERKTDEKSVSSAIME